MTVEQAIENWNGCDWLPRGTRKVLFDAGLIVFAGFSLWQVTVKGRACGLKE